MKQRTLSEQLIIDLKNNFPNFPWDKEIVLTVTEELHNKLKPYYSPGSKRYDKSYHTIRIVLEALGLTNNKFHTLILANKLIAVLKAAYALKNYKQANELISILLGVEGIRIIDSIYKRA